MIKSVLNQLTNKTGKGKLRWVVDLRGYTTTFSNYSVTIKMFVSDSYEIVISEGNFTLIGKLYNSKSTYEEYVLLKILHLTIRTLIDNEDRQVDLKRLSQTLEEL